MRLDGDEMEKWLAGIRSQPQPRLQIYLESDVEEFIRNYARQKEMDTAVIVNQWLRKNIAEMPAEKYASQ